MAVHFTGSLALTGSLLISGSTTAQEALFSKSVRANNPAEGATGEGLIAGQSFKIDATGASQKAEMYVISNVISDTYAGGLTAQYANFAGDKAFGFNLNTAGGYELYVKNSSFNKALTIAKSTEAVFASGVAAQSLTGSFLGTAASIIGVTSLEGELSNGLGLTVASGSNAHAEGSYTTATGEASHAEGTATQTLGYASHAEGVVAVASGSYSHAEGSVTLAAGDASHAEGYLTVASASYSHAEGEGTITQRQSQHAQGLYNLPNTVSLMVVGNGTNDSSRSDILRVNQTDVQITGSLVVTGQIKGTATSASYYGGSVPSASYATTSSYINTLSQSVTILGNLTVFGTQSINYITSSQLVLGTSTIQLNAQTPAVRFAGITVIDSGSVGATGSLYWDSLNNGWIYSKESGSTYHGGALLSGPRNSGNLGDEQTTTVNAIIKGQGGDHVTSSMITEDGTTFRVPFNTVITGSVQATNFTGSIQGTATSASFASTASYLLGGAAAFPFTGSAGIQGNLRVTTYLNVGTSTGSVTGEINASGDVIAFSASDINLKTSIRPIEDPIAKLKHISGNVFVWKSGYEHIHSHTGEDIGVIAQEVESVLPQIVKIRDNGYKAVDYEKIVALLIEAVKAQQVEIDELKARL